MEAIERLGAQFRARRRQLGLSQVEVSDRIGISRSQLSRLEGGKSVTLRTLFDVALDLGLDLVAVPRGSRVSNEVRAAFPDEAQALARSDRTDFIPGLYDLSTSEDGR